MAQLPLLLAVFQDMSSSLPRHLDTEEVNITDKDITSLFPYVGWLLIYLHHPTSSDKIIHVFIFYSFIYFFFHNFFSFHLGWVGGVGCAILHEIPKKPITDKNLRINHSRLQPHLPGVYDWGFRRLATRPWFNKKKCYLTTLRNPIVEIRRSYNRLISTMGFPILVRWHLYIESAVFTKTFLATSPVRLVTDQAH